MTDDSFGGDLTNCSGQLRKPSCLNVIDSLKPLSQRQALVKIHDSLILLMIQIQKKTAIYVTIDAIRAPSGCKPVVVFGTFAEY